MISVYEVECLTEWDGDEKHSEVLTEEVAISNGDAMKAGTAIHDRVLKRQSEWADDDGKAQRSKITNVEVLSIRHIWSGEVEKETT